MLTASALFITDDYERTDYPLLLAMNLAGTEEEKAQAEESFRKWTAFYGVDPALMYRIIKRETAGSFIIKAYNPKTHARGLCQLTERAIRDLKFGHRYYTTVYKYEDDVIVSRRRILYKPRVYNIDWNIRGGCAYMARCQVLGPRIRQKMPALIKLHISDDDAIILCYAWGFGNIREWISAIAYLREVQ